MFDVPDREWHFHFQSLVTSYLLEHWKWMLKLQCTTQVGSKVVCVPNVQRRKNRELVVFAYFTFTDKIPRFGTKPRLLFLLVEDVEYFNIYHMNIRGIIFSIIQNAGLVCKLGWRLSINSLPERFLKAPYTASYPLLSTSCPTSMYDQ